MLFKTGILRPSFFKVLAADRARHRSMMSLVLIGKLPRFYLIRISETAVINVMGEFAVIVVICEGILA